MQEGLSTQLRQEVVIFLADEHVFGVELFAAVNLDILVLLVTELMPAAHTQDDVLCEAGKRGQTL